VAHTYGKTSSNRYFCSSVSICVYAKEDLCFPQELITGIEN